MAVDTGIVLEFPNTVYARVAPRSGLAYKKGIQVGAGVVDSDYRDSIKVILFNHGPENFEIQVGDRIGQVIFEKIELPILEEVDFVELTTLRGTRGDLGARECSHGVSSHEGDCLKSLCHNRVEAIFCSPGLGKCQC